MAQHFQVVGGKKNCQTRNEYPTKLSFRKQEEIKIFSVEKKQIICHKQMYPLTKWLYQKKIIKGNLKHEGRKNTESKYRLSLLLSFLN